MLSHLLVGAVCAFVFFFAGTIYGAGITQKIVGDAHSVLQRAKELHESSKQMLDSIVSHVSKDVRTAEGNFTGAMRRL